jgi:hypothetical protein
MPSKQSSSAASSLAAKVLRMTPTPTWSATAAGLDSRDFVLKSAYDQLLDDAKTLAASVLSQDERKGQ